MEEGTVVVEEEEERHGWEWVARRITVDRVVLDRADDCRHGIEQPPWARERADKGSVGYKRGKSSGGLGRGDPLI
jgi:hypothetical protein